MRTPLSSSDRIINDPGFNPGTALTKMNGPTTPMSSGDYTGVAPPL